MINWPNEIIDDIARRRAVLFIGAGVSKNSTNIAGDRPKEWKEFLSYASSTTTKSAFINTLIRSGDFLTACELIRIELGRNGFNNLVRAEFQTPRFLPAEIHRHIFDLDARIVATPNFDKIYDVYAESATSGNVNVKHYYDEDIADVIRRPEPIILKVHGTITTPDKLIFSRSDYAKARSERRGFYEVLDALSLTHTFIFIGCGPNDPDVRLLLEDYTYRYKFNRQHYIISPKNATQSDVVKILEETMSLKTIEYDPRNHHLQLTASLANLAQLVEQRRRELADTMKW